MQGVAQHRVGDEDVPAGEANVGDQFFKMISRAVAMKGNAGPATAESSGGFRGEQNFS